MPRDGQENPRRRSDRRSLHAGGGPPGAGRSAGGRAPPRSGPLRSDRLHRRHEGRHRRVPRKAAGQVHGQVSVVDLKALPKVELHRHLEGSIRCSTFLELARETHLDLSRAELRRRTSMKGERPGFLRFLSKFELYRGLYPSREWIQRVAFEAAEDATREGIVHLELRFSPTHFGRRLGAKGEEVAEWIARGARRAGISVRFLATFGRDFGVKGNEPTTRAVEGTDVFSGLDLAGNEAGPARTS